jgi:hypothetical protein
MIGHGLTSTHETPNMIAIQPMADDLRDAINELAARCDPDIPPTVAKALRAFLAAKDDSDAALMRSHLDEALKAVAEAVNDAVSQRLGWPERARA